MAILVRVVQWFTDPAHWTGPDGIQTRLIQHIQLSAESVLIGAAIVRAPDASLALLMSGDNEYSTTTRLEAWGILAEIVRSSNPLLGLGPANYYWYTLGGRYAQKLDPEHDIIYQADIPEFFWGLGPALFLAGRHKCIVA